jgi:hemerythrin-like metal-binding protein
MALIEWKDSYRIGVASVDYEHERLIALLNALHAELGREPDAGVLQRFLGDVHAKIAAHFALEEQVMRERRYDQYQDHKADHERLLEEIRDIMDRTEGGVAATTGELGRELADWFAVHFRTKDARLHKMLG